MKPGDLVRRHDDWIDSEVNVWQDIDDGGSGVHSPLFSSDVGLILSEVKSYDGLILCIFSVPLRIGYVYAKKLTCVAPGEPDVP
jgi:hypothetical protein